MKALLLVPALLLAAAPARAASESKKAGAFTFLRPGETTSADAIRALGEPVIDGPTWLPKGEIDVVLAPPSPDSLAEEIRAGKELVKLHVLGWRAESGPQTHAMLVFGENDRLLYALLPPSESEASLAKIQARMGSKPDRVETRELKVAWDWTETRTIYWYDKAGVGYVATDEKHPILAKVVVAPK